MQDLFQLMADYKEYEPSTTRQQWEDFFDGALWQDIKAMLTADFVDRIEELTHPKLTDHQDMDHLRGNIETLTRVITMPHWIAREEPESDESESNHGGE